MKKLHAWVPAGLLIAVLLLAPAMRATAGTALPDSLPDAATMARFFDSIVPAQLQQSHAPCLVVTVVDSNNILFEKGWGDADLGHHIAASPDTTVWRLASISKVITGTAVMQLVEKGRLDLDRDVNDYLKTVKVPDKFGKPVTLRNLLTHTAGFDDRYIGKSFRTKEELPSLRDFLRARLPERIYPPGGIFVYSNLGNALAALVVEDVSGQDFDDYCRDHIFRPLGMKNTGYRLTKQQARHLYQGYMYQNGSYTEIPFDFLGDYPAGQLLSTAAEFSRFMMCQLNYGRLDSVRILATKTAREMQSTQFTHNPKLNGSIGFTFNISDIYGNKLVSHDGGYLGLATRMWLLPGQKTGIFLATNVMDIGMIENVSRAFVEHFFDHTPPPQQTYPLQNLPAYDHDVTKFTGYYRNTRFAHGDFTKISLLGGYGGEVHIWKNDSGMLMMHMLDGSPRRLIQTAPGVFRSIDDDYYIAFHLNAAGKPQFLFTNGTAAFEKIPAFYSVHTQLMLIGSLLSFFALLLLVRLIYLIVPRRFKRKTPLSEPNRRVRSLSTWTAGLFILHWLAMGLVLFALHPVYELLVGLAYGVPPEMYAVQLLPLIAVVTLVFMIIHFLAGLQTKETTGWSRLFYIVFMVASVVYLWLLNYWNVLGFRF